MTAVDVFAVLTTIMGSVFGVFGSVATTIMENPLLFVPILLSIGGGLILFGITVFKKLGVRGLSSGRRR